MWTPTRIHISGSQLLERLRPPMDFARTVESLHITLDGDPVAAPPPSLPDTVALPCLHTVEVIGPTTAIPDWTQDPSVWSLLWTACSRAPKLHTLRILGLGSTPHDVLLRDLPRVFEARRDTLTEITVHAPVVQPSLVVALARLGRTLQRLEMDFCVLARHLTSEHVPGAREMYLGEIRCAAAAVSASSSWTWAWACLLDLGPRAGLVDARIVPHDGAVRLLPTEPMHVNAERTFHLHLDRGADTGVFDFEGLANLVNGCRSLTLEGNRTLCPEDWARLLETFHQGAVLLLVPRGITLTNVPPHCQIRET